MRLRFVRYSGDDWLFTAILKKDNLGSIDLTGYTLKAVIVNSAGVAVSNVITLNSDEVGANWSVGRVAMKIPADETNLAAGSYAIAIQAEKGPTKFEWDDRINILVRAGAIA